MKKAISLIVIVALMAIFMFGVAGVAFAASPVAENNACDHASPVAQNHASPQSVVGNCDEPEGP